MTSQRSSMSSIHTTLLRRARRASTWRASSWPSSGVSGEPARKHDLHRRVEALRRRRAGSWMPFWRVTRPTKITVGAVRVDAVALQGLDAVVGVPLDRVDAVVHDVHPARVDGRVAAQHVVA